MAETFSYHDESEDEDIEYTVSQESRKVFDRREGDDVIMKDWEYTSIKLKCPNCDIGVSTETPKCPWEQGGDCGRHKALAMAKHDQRKRKNAAVEGLLGAGI